MDLVERIAAKIDPSAFPPHRHKSCDECDWKAHVAKETARAVLSEIERACEDPKLKALAGDLWRDTLNGENASKSSDEKGMLIVKGVLSAAPKVSP